MSTSHRRNDHLEHGRASFERRAWAQAYQQLALADQLAPLDGDDLERFTWTAGLMGRDEDLLRLLERVYQAHVDAGRGAPAARAAFWLAMRLYVLGETGRSGGWFGRAQRLIEREPEPVVEAGYLMIPMIHRQLGAGELEAAEAAAVRAGEIGDRFGDRDLVALAGQLRGRALVRQGHLEAGLAVLDEVMVAASAEELSPLVTGLVYCAVISSYQQVYALDRAREWTSALARWCEAQPELVTFTSACLVHRSEIMQLGGEWHEAIAEARRVCERFDGKLDPQGAAQAFYQQAEIHRLKGELAEAEESYRRASQLGLEPQPGLALLRLIQGDAQSAASGIRRAVEATADPLMRTRYLPAFVEIMLAVGDLPQARRGAGLLEESAGAYKTEVLGAIAAHARAAVGLAEGEARAAVDPVRAAFRVWQRIGAPYIAARLRVLLGQACLALGDSDGARLELAAAREVFRQLGAAPDLAVVDALEAAMADSKQPVGERSHGLTPRELQVLRLIASGKTNKAIASELDLSEKTVDRHVSNIFNKIDVSTRAAATAYAYQHALV